MSLQTTLYTCRHGILAHYARDEVIGKSLELYGEWAEDEIAMLSSFLSRGSTVVDVGANVGTHTLGFSRIVGSDGIVIAIEGEPDTFCLLASNVVRNNLLGTVKPLQMLCGNDVKVLQYPLQSEERQNAGAKSFVGETDDVNALPGVAYRPVAISTLDSLNLSGCDVLKIDVEGMEPDVLAGGIKTIESCQPVIYFEHAADDPVRLKRSVDILSPFGYTLYFHFSNPFASNNFNGCSQNIFGGTVELNILGCPSGVKPPYDLIEVVAPYQSPARPTLDSQVVGVKVPTYLD
jgi:FkbM family methyltransferase